MFGSKNTRHSVIQSELKRKPIVTRLHTFSRALLRLLAITSSFDWITVLSVSFCDWSEQLLLFRFYRIQWKPALAETHDLYNGNYIHSSLPVKCALLHKHELNYINMYTVLIR